MFVLKKDHTFWWPVPVRVPADGGRHEVQRLEVQFKALPQDRIDQAARGRDDDADEDLLKEVILDWKGVVDVDRQPVPCSEEAKAVMVSMLYVRKALVKAYFDGLAGDKRKN